MRKFAVLAASLSLLALLPFEARAQNDDLGDLSLNSLGLNNLPGASQNSDASGSQDNFGNSDFGGGGGGSDFGGAFGNDNSQQRQQQQMPRQNQFNGGAGMQQQNPLQFGLGTQFGQGGAPFQLGGFGPFGQFGNLAAMQQRQQQPQQPFMAAGQQNPLAQLLAGGLGPFANAMGGPQQNPLGALLGGGGGPQQNPLGALLNPLLGGGQNPLGALGGGLPNLLG